MRAPRQEVQRIRTVCAFVSCLLIAVTAAARDADNTLPARASNADLPACLSASGEAAVVSCRQELSQAPNDLAIRFALCDVLIELRRHEEAVEVLREGLRRSPGSNRIKRKLAIAESYLEEQQWIEKRRAQSMASSRDAAEGKLDTATKLNIIRCKKLKGEKALKACDAALNVRPKDPSLRLGKADALLSTKRIGEAVLVYREALRLDADNTNISRKLEAAESQRKSTVTDCKRLAGRAALDACNRARITGSADELAMQTRTADLLLEMKRTAEALEAYKAALKLNPNATEIRNKIAALTRPVSVATTKAPTSQQRASKPRAQVAPRKPSKPAQPIPPAATPSPKEAVSRTEAPAQIAAANPVARQAVNIDTSPTTTETPPPVVPQPRRYSNRPAVAGITH